MSVRLNTRLLSMSNSAFDSSLISRPNNSAALRRMLSLVWIGLKVMFAGMTRVGWRAAVINAAASGSPSAFTHRSRRSCFAGLIDREYPLLENFEDQRQGGSSLPVLGRSPLRSQHLAQRHSGP